MARAPARYPQNFRLLSTSILQTTTMAPPHTPTKPKRHEFDTPQRARFYHAYDSQKNTKSLASICKQDDVNIKPPTARRWLKEREILGSPANRRTRNRSDKLGRPYTLPESFIDAILD